MDLIALTLVGHVFYFNIENIKSSVRIMTP